MHCRALFCLLLLASFPPSASARNITVNTDLELHTGLKNAQPGDHLQLGPGPFKGGFFAVGVKGTSNEPIRISGPSAEKPAVFQADATGILQLVQSTQIEVANLHIKRSQGNAISFDDGGARDFSCHHITIKNVRIDDVGPKGTACSIKMAGVSDFSITDCTFKDWGEGGGCAVDGVGCKRGVVERCQFLPGRGSVAIQFKGGSEAIAIRGCLIDDAGERGINLGGSTGLQFFRPKPLGFEARDVTVEGNILIGTGAPICFPNTDGATIRFNTIYLPKKWAFRILQETLRDDFTPSRKGQIEDNIIVFKSQWYEGGVNVGPNTAPETFTFARNLWYCVDSPARSKPRLPTAEVDSLVGHDPLLVDPTKHDFSLRAGSPAIGKGHTGLKRASK